MIINDLRLDLFKAKGDMRSGHKYIRRWREGDRWRYEYADTPDGPVGVRYEADPVTRESTGQVVSAPVTVRSLATDGMPEETAFHTSMMGALRDPSEPIQVSHRHLGALDVEVSVAASGNIRMHVQDKDGNRLYTAKNPGQFERWFLGTSAMEEINDIDGKPWVIIKPNVGKVVDGVLVPSTDVDRQWKVEFHPEYPQDKQDEHGKKHLG